MLEHMKKAAQFALSKFRVGIGSHHIWMIDEGTSGEVNRFGASAVANLRFNLSPHPHWGVESVQCLAEPNMDNTSAKIYMLVEIGTVQMTDESLRF